MGNPVYSFVLPVFNEEETLPELQKRLSTTLDRLDGPWEVVMINDGSRDRSLELMRAIHGRDSRFRIINFSRNFGHQIAITAGIDHARGDAVIIMDSDLQDPPEVVLEMIRKWKEGFEVVYAVRTRREGETWFKKMTAKAYYRMLRQLVDIDIPSDVGDFRLVDRKAVDAFKQLREKGRYVRGMFSWVGFRQTGVHYERAERYAGETKYPLRKMLKFATDGALSFSNVPLRLVLTLGFMVSGLSMMAGVFALVAKIFGLYTVSGWTSMMVLQGFIGGIQLIVLGVMGQYIGRIYDEVKHRPVYIVDALIGFERTNGPQMQ